MVLSTPWTEKKTTAGAGRKMSILFLFFYIENYVWNGRHSPFRKAIEMMALFLLLVVVSVMKERRPCGNRLLVRACMGGSGVVVSSFSWAGAVEVGEDLGMTEWQWQCTPD